MQSYDIMQWSPGWIRGQMKGLKLNMIQDIVGLLDTGIKKLFVYPPEMKINPLLIIYTGSGWAPDIVSLWLCDYLHNRLSNVRNVVCTQEIFPQPHEEMYEANLETCVSAVGWKHGARPQ